MKAYHTRISEDGQISLGKEVLMTLGLKPDDLVDVHIDEAGVHIRRHVWTLETVMGSVKTPPHLSGMSIEEIIRQARLDYADEKALEFMNLSNQYEG